MLISRGCSWVSMKRGGCKFGDGKTRGYPGGCSFAVGTQTQRVSAPPPPWSERCGTRWGRVGIIWEVLGRVQCYIIQEVRGPPKMCGSHSSSVKAVT